MNIISWVNQLWTKWHRWVTFTNNLFKGICFQTIFWGDLFFKGVPSFLLAKHLFPLFRHFCWRDSPVVIQRVPPIPLTRYPCFPCIHTPSSMHDVGSASITDEMHALKEPSVQLARCMREAHYNKSYQFKKNNQNKVKNILCQSSITITISFNFFSLKSIIPNLTTINYNHI